MKTLTDEEYEELLRKADYQIPHKPEYVCNGYADGNPVYDAYCPKCDNELDEGIIFCEKCGQKIDWEE